MQSAVLLRQVVCPSVFLSVCPSVCDVVEYFKNKFTISYPGVFSLCRPNIIDLLQREHPEILVRIGVGWITCGIVLLVIYSFTFTSAFMYCSDRIRYENESLMANLNLN